MPTDGEVVDEKKGSSAALAGTGAGGVAIGAIGGALLSKLTADPTKFADYVIEKGSVGILLVLSVILVVAVWKLYARQTSSELRHQRELASNARAYQTELTNRDAKYAQKVEDLMRDQVKLAQKCTRLMAKTEVALRKMNLTPEEEEALDADADAENA